MGGTDHSPLGMQCNAVQLHAVPGSLAGRHATPHSLKLCSPGRSSRPPGNPGPALGKLEADRACQWGSIDCVCRNDQHGQAGWQTMLRA